MQCFSPLGRRLAFGFLQGMSLSLTISCQSGVDRIQTIARDFWGKVEFYDAHQDAEIQASPLWLNPHGKGIAAASSAVDPLKDKPNLMMVNFFHKSDLALQLQQDPLTKVYDSGTPSETGFALVEVPSPLHKDSLAIAAHHALGHVCGSVESLSSHSPYALTLSEGQEIVSPVIAESVLVPAVESLLARTTATRIGQYIAQLEALGTRFHSSESGISTPEKIATMMREAAGNKLPKLDIRFQETSNSAQSSVIASLPGEKDDATTVIIGAHLDSINKNGSSFPAPGADDDASGVATMLEALKAIADAGATFQRRIEFHAYGAEEVGLDGSITVAEKYKRANRVVAGMMQIDMDAWASGSDSTIYFVTTTTTPYLVRASKDLLHTYVGGDFAEGPLTAGTSDHKSWYIRGFPAVFPFENPADYNRALHSEQDTSQTLNNLPLALRFSRLALAFLAHEAGLMTPTQNLEEIAKKTRANFSKEIKIAVSSSNIENAYKLAFATDDGRIKSVEVCRVKLKGSMACSHARLKTMTSIVRNNRSTFTLENPLGLVEGDRLAVFGYDASEKLTAQRTVRFIKR